MIESRTFSTLAALSVTTGRLLTRPKSDSNNGIGDMQELMEYMVGESVWTHQMPRVGDECKPAILEQHPEFAAMTDEIIERCERGEVTGLMDELVEQFGETCELSPLNRGMHESKHPVSELTEMMGQKDTDA